MKIAVPVVQGKLAMHFGHCEEFACFDVDDETGAVVAEETLPAPEHQPGLLPRWLAELGVDIVIAGGMGQRAQALFAAQNIRLAIGAPAGEPEALAMAYVNNTLETGPNICDH